MLAAFSGTAQAQTRTWTGLGTTNNWSDGGNWSGGVAPVNGAALVWGATSTARLSSNNDISGLSPASMSFISAPNGVVLSGNPLTFTTATPFGSNGLTGTSSLTFNLDLALLVN